MPDKVETIYCVERSEDGIVWKMYAKMFATKEDAERFMGSLPGHRVILFKRG